MKFVIQRKCVFAHTYYTHRDKDGQYLGSIASSIVYTIILLYLIFIVIDAHTTHVFIQIYVDKDETDDLMIAGIHIQNMQHK